MAKNEAKIASEDVYWVLFQCLLNILYIYVMWLWTMSQPISEAVFTTGGHVAWLHFVLGPRQLLFKWRFQQLHSFYPTWYNISEVSHVLGYCRYRQCPMPLSKFRVLQDISRQLCRIQFYAIVSKITCKKRDRSVHFRHYYGLHCNVSYIAVHFLKDICIGSKYMCIV